MSWADDFDKIGGPLQKPLRKKPTLPTPAQPDATAVRRSALKPDADSIEKRIRAEPQPEDAFTRFSRKPDARTPSNRSLYTQGRPEPAIPDTTLEGDLTQAELNLRKK